MMLMNKQVEYEKTFHDDHLLGENFKIKLK